MLASLGCTSEWENNHSEGMDPRLEGKPVTVTFSVPDVRIAPSTKSLEDGSGDITGAPYLDPDKLYLVICGHSQSIKYIRKAEMLVDGDGNPITTPVPVSSIPDYPLDDGATSVDMYSFTVQLELSDTDRTIHFLANVDENQLMSGAYSYQLLPSLVSYEGKQAFWQKVYLDSIHPKLDGDNQPIIENGSYLPSDETAAKLRYVPLIRNYAKIQVTDATAEEEAFELFSYAVIFYPKSGSVVPYRSNAASGVDPFSFGVTYDAQGNPEYRLSGYERCSFTNLDEDLDYLGHLLPNSEFNKEIPSADLFEHPENSNGRVIRYNKNDPDQGFYIYERTIPNDNLEPTFVIIRGKFGDTDDYYYYRLDLMETKMVNYESIYQYYPIYRNFRYNIQLNRISSVGVSSPEAAANSSGAKDISADVSMRHLNDISNGLARLVVEPFMSKTYSGPNEEGYYYLYARFFNDLNSADPNVDWGAVSVELEPMEDGSEDILTLYDDVGNEVHGFFPSSQMIGGEPGFRIIRFNTVAPGNETKTQKIKITGRNLYTHEEFPLYREVEISLQKRQPLHVTCSVAELSPHRGAKQTIMVTIPSALPESMFPLEFTFEAENATLTPDNSFTSNNLPVTSGRSLSDKAEFEGKQAIQFIRTLTLDEYYSLPVVDGQRTFYSYFKSNCSYSATTVWVTNDYFTKGYVSFENTGEPTGHFWVKNLAAADIACVMINNNNLQYNLDFDDEGWLDYKKNSVIELGPDQKVSFRSTQTILSWKDGQFNCYKKTSANTAKDGVFAVGGNLASLIIGDSYEAEGSDISGNFTFIDFLKNHVNLLDASELEFPMLTCKTNCYKSFFDGCTSLVSGPAVLPAMTMANTCYRNMFLNCSSLVDAPYLPATNINNNCYQRMFEGCTSLKLIKMNGANYNSGCFTDWVKGMSAGGEIWLNPAIKTSSGFENIIPLHGKTGQWTLKQLPNGDDWSY